MRKMFMILLVLLMSVSFAFANGAEEMPNELVVLHSGDTTFSDGSTLFGRSTEMLKKDFPDITIKWNKIDLSDGSTLTMDAMLAANTAPNIYIDTMVRASKYMVPEFAVPLDPLVRDLNKYQEGVLDSYRSGGSLMALPVPGDAQAMLINLDLMEEIGYKVQPDWTIKDFLEMAELVKAKYNGKKFATGMFAANQSGDYLMNAWFASFGVKFYNAGNYDAAVIADTGGAKVYEFFQQLMKSGYIPFNSASLTDDDYCAQWMVGDIAATAFFPSWTKPYFDTALSQKLIDAPFKYTFVPFPRAPGVTKVPTYYSNGAMIVHATGTPIDKVSARLIEYINSPSLQGMLAINKNVIPNRIDVKESPNDARVQEVVAIVNTNGLQDVGLTDPRFTERRALQFPILQQVLTFKMSPDAAIQLYQKKLSSVER